VPGYKALLRKIKLSEERIAQSRLHDGPPESGRSRQAAECQHRTSSVRIND
jgi:hypothetical protein